MSVLRCICAFRLLQTSARVEERPCQAPQSAAQAVSPPCRQHLARGLSSLGRSRAKHLRRQLRWWQRRHQRRQQGGESPREKLRAKLRENCNEFLVKFSGSSIVRLCGEKIPKVFTQNPHRFSLRFSRRASRCLQRCRARPWSSNAKSVKPCGSSQDFVSTSVNSWQWLSFAVKA